MMKRITIATGGIVLLLALRGLAEEQLGPSSNQETDVRSSDGDAWKETLKTFDTWAKIQVVYDPDKISAMRAKILEKSKGLSPDEADQFRWEVNSKLEILYSEEARAARSWLIQTLGVASDAYAEKLKAKVPDVTKKTPADLVDALFAFEARHSDVQRNQQSVQESRLLAIKAAQENASRQAEASARSREAAIINPPAPAIQGPKPQKRFQPLYPLKDPYEPFFRFW